MSDFPHIHLPVPVVALCLTLAGCGTSGPMGEPTAGPPTAHDRARQDHERIADEATVLLYAEPVGFREGSTTAQRVPVACSGATCAFGFTANRSADDISISEDSVFEIQGGPNGVGLFTETGGGMYSDYVELGGWMEHSLFASRVDHFTNESDPDVGSTLIRSFALGNAARANPVIEGTVHWRGFMAGRGTGHDNLAAGYLGDAEICVDFGETGLRMEADVYFWNITSSSTEVMAIPEDMVWRNLAVTDSAFSHRGEDGNSLTGGFFGPNHEEAAGVFERDQISGAFGGIRNFEKGVE